MSRWNRGRGSKRDYDGQGFRQRFYKNRYKSRRPSNDDVFGESSTSNSNIPSYGRGKSYRGRHPPGLKGRQIGLFYRDRAKAMHKEKITLPITLREHTQKKIQELINAHKSPVMKPLDNWKKHADKDKDSKSMYHHVGDSQFKREFLEIITGNIEEKLEKSITAPQRQPNEKLDKELLQNYKKMQASQKYANMLNFRKKLPAYKMRQEILDLVENHQVILINGETGCGKTTQVAQFILDNELEKGRGSITNIACTQPRRISAISVAERVAAERGESLGNSVGFQIRLEKNVSRDVGGILYCTTGILLQFMQSDPALCDYSHIILDEIHERNVDGDFIMTLLKQVIPLRPDLKVILMSATMNSEKFSKYYDNCPSLLIPGFTYPVEELYLEDVLAITSFKFENKFENKFSRHDICEESDFINFVDPFIRNLDLKKYPNFVAKELRKMCSENLSLELILELTFYIGSVKDPGAILIFLPGLMDINKLLELLIKSGRFPSSKYVIYPLHSKMPTVDQKQIFKVPPTGMRKIIIATSIAETSITIEDVVYVIDSGKTKLTKFDIENNIQTLKPEWITEANARQRKGRAGRVKPGICYHLYTSARAMTFDKSISPEMLRTRLDGVILKIKILQLGKAANFLSRVMDPPDPKVIELSLNLLRSLNALDSNENLTPMGYHLAQLPVDPRTGKMMILGALFSCSEPIFAIAASLSFKDAFYCPLEKELIAREKKKELGLGQFSDHIALAEALRRFETPFQGTGKSSRSFCYEYFLSWNTLKLLSDMKKQLASHMYNMKFLSSDNVSDNLSNRNSQNKALVKAIVCAGLYPNIAIAKGLIRRSGCVKGITIEEERVMVHPSSINHGVSNFPSPYLIYFLKQKSKAIYLHDTTSVSPLAILFAAPNSSIVVEGGKSIIKVGKLTFQCQQRTAKIIKELHEKLDCMLEYKVAHPGTVDWNGKDGYILRAIIESLAESEEHLGLESSSHHTWDNFDEESFDFDDWNECVDWNR